MPSFRRAGFVGDPLGGPRAGGPTFAELGSYYGVAIKVFDWWTVSSRGMPATEVRGQIFFVELGGWLELKSARRQEVHGR